MNLPEKLRSFFNRYQPPAEDVQRRLKQDVMASFRAAQNQQTMHRWVFWRRTGFALSMVMVVSVVGIFSSTITPNRVKAGTIQAQYGPVEIIRGERSFLVRDEMDIFVGDLVKVGYKGEAELNLKNQAVSQLDQRTNLRVTDIDALFIEKGKLNSESFKGVEVATDRGLIRTTPGAKFVLEVSETGQTKVGTEKNIVQVYDLQDGQALLSQGEELILHSDTQLSFIDPVNNQALSATQLESLQSKLAITRSKLLSAVEGQLSGQRRVAADEFVSAAQSFKSLTQVLLTSRELDIARRKNLDEVNLAEVYDILSARVNHSGILDEVESLTLAFEFFQSIDQPLGIRLVDTGDSNLNKYLLLKKIAESQSGKTQIAFELLASKYVVNFLAQIQNQPLFVDQVAVLQNKVSGLPNDAVTYYFLRHVGQKMSPDLSAALENEIAKHF